MKLARVIRLDKSDENVFDIAAEPGEFALSGAFEFSDWQEDDLVGKGRQAFSNGWLGLESFGRATFVAVAPITEDEYEGLADRLAAHFVARYGAPIIEIARPVALEELSQMREMCEDHESNTLLVVTRELEAIGVREQFRSIAPRSASLEAFAVHGS